MAKLQGVEGDLNARISNILTETSLRNQEVAQMERETAEINRESAQSLVAWASRLLNDGVRVVLPQGELL